MASTLAQEQVYKSHADSFEPHENRSFTSRDIPTGPDGSAAERQDEASTSDLIHSPLRMFECTQPSLPSVASKRIASEISETAPRQRPAQMFRNTVDVVARHKRILKRDLQVDRIGDCRVLCANCRKWVSLLEDNGVYREIAWDDHKRTCTKPIKPPRKKPGPKPGQKKRESTTASGVGPETSSGYVQLRRTEAERITFLLSDPHTTTVEPHRILCAICRRWIQLRKNSTYCTAPWVQHAEKCAERYNVPRLIRTPSGVGDAADEDIEEDLEPFEFVEDSPPEVVQEDVVPKRGRGRPRKRKPGQPKEPQPASFALRPVADGPHPSPSGAAQESGPRSVSPPALRTPSPLPNHPYSTDVYWYPTLPPMSTYYPLYTGSQYNESDDSYSLYFHAQPPVHQPGPPTAQSRPRGKPSKSRNSTKTPGSGPGAPPNLFPSGSTQDSQSFPGPDGSATQPGRAWVVWRLKNYSTNSCPMDSSSAPESRSASMQRGGSEASGSGSEPPLPLYRSGTWPHLLDPHGLSRAQNLSPYVHHEAVINGKNAPSTPRTHSAQFGQPNMVAPSYSGLVNFSSTAPIPIHNGEPYRPPPLSRTPRPLPPPPHATTPDIKHEPRFSTSSRSVRGPVAPEPPKGSDLDLPECRLSYTFKSIAYLFKTSYQGADDMSLDTLTEFMNRRIPRDKVYDGQEVSAHVAVLGERKQLMFTKEGGVQLLASP